MSTSYTNKNSYSCKKFFWLNLFSQPMIVFFFDQIKIPGSQKKDSGKKNEEKKV
jgi:hypothetical protein